MWSHPTWCLLVALSTLVSGSKVPRQIVYQIRPAPTSAFTTQDGTFYLDDGVTGYQFPTFGLKAPESKAFRTHSASVLGLAGNKESGDVDSSSSSSSSSSGSSSPSEESSSAATREEITDVPTFGSHLRSVGHPQILQLQPEQIQQIFNSYKPQVQQIQQQQPQQQQDEQKEQENIDVGPRYEYKSIEESANSSSDDIKVAQTEAITEEKLQSAYSERREKRRRKQQEDPPGDASYAFGYETDESARHEVAEPDGTVKGWYSYVDTDGITRRITYSAGAGKGFVVLGKEKIKGPGTASQPRPQQQQRRKQKPNNRVNTEYGYAADSSTISSLKQQKPPSTPSSFSNYFNNWSDLGKAETAIPPQPTVLATVDTPTRTKKPVFIVKIRRPVHKDQYDDDESGYDGSSSQGSSASSSGEYDTGHDSGEYNSGKGANYGGGGGGTGGDGLPVKSDPDASYVFGYETTDSNRLEKADKYGNVRGSYAYIDDEGNKRITHYLANKNGFQVIHASPSISRGVRLEAPPGYVVKRVPSLRTSESRYPIPISVPRPSAIVYHIHPDSGWKPWEPTLRKKKVKIHRKKLSKEFFQNARRDGIVLLQTHSDPAPKVTHFSTGEATSSGSMGAGSNNMYFKEKVTAAGTGTVTATETQVPYVPMSPPVSRRRHAPQRGYTADHHTYQIDDYGSEENTAATTYQQQQHSKSKQSSSASSQSAPSSSSSAGTSEAPGPGLYSPAPFESMRESVENRRSPTPNPVQLQSTQVAIKSRGAPTQTPAGLDTSSSNHHPVAFTSDGKLQVDVPTVIIEAIEAKSSASLVAKKDTSNKSVIHHKLPEAAALTQSSSPVDLAVSSTSNLIKGPTPTSRPSAYELVSASSVNYQPSSVSAPTPPAASAPSIFNSQKSYTPSIASNNNVIHHHHQKQSSSTSSSSLSSSSSSSVATTTTPPSRSRRRHHRSKTASSTTPTSPSSTNSASSSSNSIKAVVGGNQETSTAMSSSKRLINRLAATEHEATVAA